MTRFHPVFNALLFPNGVPVRHVKKMPAAETVPDVCKRPNLSDHCAADPSFVSVVQVAKPPRFGTYTVADHVFFTGIPHIVTEIYARYPLETQPNDKYAPFQTFHIPSLQRYTNLNPPSTSTIFLSGL